MKVQWQSAAWEDYRYWQKTGNNVVRRINDLIKEGMRTPFTGIGKPEPLKWNFSGCWSRRITDEHRLVYQAGDEMIYILQCRYHYS